IRTDIRLITGRTVWITRFPCLFIPASGFEPGAAIGSASTSVRDHRLIVFGAPLPFRLRERGLYVFSQLDAWKYIQESNARGVALLRFCPPVCAPILSEVVAHRLCRRAGSSGGIRAGRDHQPLRELRAAADQPEQAGDQVF